jgi:hypothetical protein
LLQADSDVSWRGGEAKNNFDSPQKVGELNGHEGHDLFAVDLMGANGETTIHDFDADDDQLSLNMGEEMTAEDACNTFMATAVQTGRHVNWTDA